MSNVKIKPGDLRQRLRAGTMLDESYIIDGEIGAGGFGITYEGRDMRLGPRVAIKEYFPAEIGHRDSSLSVHPLAASNEEIFAWGRDGFIREAQMLASFKHTSIVRVLRFFEANNTAYMVLEYEPGPSLAMWLEQLEQRGRRPSQAELDRITDGLVDALATIHAERLVHRDIAPDNIIIRADLTPVVLDFGAARYEVAVASRPGDQPEHTRSFAIVKAHYSPIEQRATDTRNRGPWSDVYSLGATLYRAVAGRAPIDSHDRMADDKDPLLPAVEAAQGHYRPSFLAAIDRALMLRRHERPQTVREFRDLAIGPAPAVQPAPPSPRSLVPSPEARRRRLGLVMAVTLGAVALAGMAAAIAIPDRSGERERARIAEEKRQAEEARRAEVTAAEREKSKRAEAEESSRQQRLAADEAARRAAEDRARAERRAAEQKRREAEAEVERQRSAVAAWAGGNLVPFSTHGHVAVVSSLRTREDAIAKARELAGLYTPWIGGKVWSVKEYDIPDKGVWHRVMIGPPGSEQSARNVCAALASWGVATCWPAPY